MKHIISKINELFYSWKIKRIGRTTIVLKVMIFLIALKEKFNKKSIDKEWKLW